MRESQLYLNFFKKNFSLLILLGLFGAGLGGVYQAPRLTVFEQSSLWEMVYDQTNVSASITLADQAVTLVRSAHLQGQFGISEGSVTVYKPGPLAIEIKVSNQSKEIIEKTHSQIEDYLKGKFPVKKIGQTVNSDHQPKVFWGIALGAVVGFGAGLLISLVKSYFKNF